MSGIPGAAKLSDAVSCPRCGYDQHGEMSTWTTGCPLESTCTECGLRIHWAELFDDRLRGPRWCVEYARTPLAIRPSQTTASTTFCDLALRGT